MARLLQDPTSARVLDLFLPHFSLYMNNRGRMCEIEKFIPRSCGFLSENCEMETCYRRHRVSPEQRCVSPPRRCIGDWGLFVNSILEEHV